MTQSTVPADRSKQPKPAKPRPDFPLYPHLSGKWAKTIRGRTHYFGTWDDPEGALREYLDQKDDLYAGRVPRSRTGALTVAGLGNEFLRHCRAKMEAGDLSPRTYRDYVSTTDRIVRVLGKGGTVEGLGPADFARLRADIASTRGPVSLSNEITRARVVFHFAFKNLLIAAPVQYGMALQRPSKKTLRQAKAKNGKRMFDAEECRQLIDHAHTPELKAMMMLGLNCGFGNSDCSKLPLDALDLDAGWLDYPRPKTGIPRRCPLWPETVAALREVLGRRERRDRLHAAKAGGPSPTVFLTKFGTLYENDQTTVTNEFAKVLDRLGLRRPGRGFYTLRHVFRTVADSTRDFPACRAIMGHCDDSMDAVYREGVDDARLVAVVEHVRAWLWPEGMGQ